MKNFEYASPTTEAEVLEMCRHKIAGYKMPKAVHFLKSADLPRSETGTRAHVASKILDAAKRGEITADRLRQVGIEALRSAPTMWR